MIKMCLMMILRIFGSPEKESDNTSQILASQNVNITS